MRIKKTPPGKGAESANPIARDSALAGRTVAHQVAGKRQEAPSRIDKIRQVLGPSAFAEYTAIYLKGKQDLAALNKRHTVALLSLYDLQETELATVSNFSIEIITQVTVRHQRQLKNLRDLFHRETDVLKASIKAQSNPYAEICRQHNQRVQGAASAAAAAAASAVPQAVCPQYMPEPGGLPGLMPRSSASAAAAQTQSDREWAEIVKTLDAAPTPRLRPG